MKNIPLKKIFYAALVCLAIAGALWAYRWLKIDSCLDLGGRWDYVENRCDP
jgi:hypothetical protein